jgi:MYXO-CTERM domain-containing protein
MLRCEEQGIHPTPMLTPTTSSSSTLDWNEAGIGAALLLVAVGGLVTIRRRNHGSVPLRLAHA